MCIRIKYSIGSTNRLEKEMMFTDAQQGQTGQLSLEKHDPCQPPDPRSPCPHGSGCEQLSSQEAGASGLSGGNGESARGHKLLSRPWCPLWFRRAGPWMAIGRSPFGAPPALAPPFSLGLKPPTGCRLVSALTWGVSVGTCTGQPAVNQETRVIRQPQANRRAQSVLPQGRRQTGARLR